jgi:TM2 domain-containing membrane protein YozV
MSYYPPNQPQPYGQPYPMRPMPTAAPKSGGVALILSFLIPGLGHLYTGNPLSAVLWFGSAVAIWTISFLLTFVGFPYVFIALPFVYLGAMIHAYISASNFNIRHHAIR